MHLSLLVFALLSQFPFSVSQNHVYHFINESKSWSAAKQYCRKYYTDLATVNSMTDVKKLKQAASDKDAWIGLHQTSDKPKDRKWHWSQPGVKYNVSEDNWKEGEPTNDTMENCVKIQSNGTWIDTGCNWIHCFICYNETSTHLNYDKDKKWLEARKHCRERSMDLISGRDQLDKINSTLLNNSKCSNGWWIGLFRDTWGWSDGSDSSIRIWNEWNKVLDPAVNNKKCATVGEQGNLESCNSSRPFICYDKRFILVRENKTWEEALIHCRRHHLDLAWHNGPHQRRMVRERAKMADSEVVWLGLHFTCFFEEWIWVNGHYVPRDDENWKDHGNNNNNNNNKCEFSGAMERGGDNKWVKRPSEQKHNFICVQKG